MLQKLLTMLLTLTLQATKCTLSSSWAASLRTAPFTASISPGMKRSPEGTPAQQAHKSLLFVIVIVIFSQVSLFVSECNAAAAVPFTASISPGMKRSPDVTPAQQAHTSWCF
jgi:hypothetical protein